MKKFSVLSLLLALSLTFVSCKSKKNTGSSGSSQKTIASATAELGMKPPIVVTMNIASFRKSVLWTFVEKSLKKELKEKSLKNFDVNKLEKVLVLATDNNKDPAKTKAYIVIKGIDTSTLKNMLGDKIKPAKLNGKNVFSTVEKGVTSYIFSPTKNIVVMVAGDWSKKVTPGKGTLGTGSLVNTVGNEALSFSASGLKDFKQGKAVLDLSSGLSFNGEFNIGAKKVDEAIKNYEKGKKQLDQMPIPGLTDLINAVKIKKIGNDTIGVKIKLSEKQLKDTIKLAQGFLTGMLK